MCNQFLQCLRISSSRVISGLYKTKTHSILFCTYSGFGGESSVSNFIGLYAETSQARRRIEESRKLSSTSEVLGWRWAIVWPRLSCINIKLRIRAQHHDCSSLQQNAGPFEQSIAGFPRSTSTEQHRKPIEESATSSGYDGELTWEDIEFESPVLVASP